MARPCPTVEMLAAGWDDGFGGGRRFARLPVEELHGRPPAGLAFGQAAHQWLLQGQQHRALGHTAWVRARGSRWWTPAAEAGVQWVAGEDCRLTASRSASPPAAPQLGSTELATATGHLNEGELLGAATTLLEGTTAIAREGEAQLRRLARLASASAAEASELVCWTPHFHSEVVRDLTAGEFLGARRIAGGILRDAQSVEVAATEAAAQVAAAATLAATIRQTLAAAATHVWSNGAQALSAEGAAVLDLSATVVATMATALDEMRHLAARKLDHLRWQVLAGERRVRRAQQEERCAAKAHRLWVAKADPLWGGETDHWGDLVVAAAATAAEADGDGDDEAGQGLGGTDLGSDRNDGDGAGNSGSRGQSGSDDGGGSVGGPTGGVDDGGGMETSARWENRGEWRGDGGGWRARWACSWAIGMKKQGVYWDGVEESVVGGGRRRRGARRMRLRGWRRWLCRGQSYPSEGDRVSRWHHARTELWTRAIMMRRRSLACYRLISDRHALGVFVYCPILSHIVADLNKT